MEPTPPSTEASTGRVGLWMFVLFWLVAGSFAVFAFNDWLNARNNPNPNPQSDLINGRQTVQLQAGPRGHYVATGQINGQSVTFLVDTGASSVALSEALARRLDLQLGPAGISQTAAGRTRVYSTVLDSVSLGGIELNQIPAVVIPAMDDGAALLGMSFLRHLEISHRGDTLTIRR